MNTTVTGDPVDDRPHATGRTCTRIVFIADTEDRNQPSSLHNLDDIEEVRFVRGARSCERAGHRLVLASPDVRMSSEHGRLVRHDARWVVDDPSSKNGIILDGTVARRAVVQDGSVLELGRSFLVFRHGPAPGIPERFAADLEARELPQWPRGMATFSPSFASVLDTLVRIAPTNVSLVLLGETGTGKELLARAVHELSRREGAFVAVNCGALPETLIESELFGYRKGAFSGALAERRGLVRSADRGTLLLDEIGELPPASQAALLRVLQEREVLPVGDDRPSSVDIRVIAATLCDLDRAARDGRFRDDLYARISGHVVELPPLRERREDLGLLLAELVPATTSDRPVRFAPAALRALLRYDWPRNIRELQQALVSAAALAPAGMIDVEHLPVAVRAGAARSQPDAAVSDPSDRDLRQLLVALFTEHRGNVSAVAAALGKQRQQIYKWIDRLSIDVSEFREPG